MSRPPRLNFILKVGYSSVIFQKLFTGTFKPPKPVLKALKDRTTRRNMVHFLDPFMKSPKLTRAQPSARQGKQQVGLSLEGGRHNSRQKATAGIYTMSVPGFSKQEER